MTLWNTLAEIILAVWATFYEMAPYLLLGLTFAGVLHVLFKKEFITRHLGKASAASVIKAAVLGVPLPLCSCGVIPTALSLRKSNASRGAVMSFLVSTPQTGVDSIIATYGMMGPVFAVFRPIAAFFMGIFGGLLTGRIDREPVTDTTTKAGDDGFSCVVCDVTHEHTHTLREKMRSMIRYGYGSFLDDISLQLIVGIFISGLITFFVPEDLFGSIITSDFIGMLIMIVAGIPLYVCATASIPIAVALMAKGVSPGVAFVFLAVGPATNAASLTLILHALGKRFTALYLGTMIAGAIATGYALNFLHRWFNVSPEEYMAHHLHESGSVLTDLWVALFALIMLLSLFRKLFPGAWYRIFRFRAHTHDHPPATGASREIAFGVAGMTCNHCVAHVREAIEGVEGVEQVQVDLNAKRARVTGHAPDSAVIKAVEEAGYKAFR